MRCNGDSRQNDLNAMAEAIHGITFALHCHVYYEWVESAANWADGICRGGRRDTWLLRHKFKVRDCTVPGFALRLPLGAAMNLAEYM